jgi:hypothetical protein
MLASYISIVLILSICALLHTEQGSRQSELHIPSLANHRQTIGGHQKKFSIPSHSPSSTKCKPGEQKVSLLNPSSH